MMRHDGGERRADCRPLRLTGPFHAPRQQQGHGIGKRLIAAQAEGDRAVPIGDLAAGLR